MDLIPINSEKLKIILTKDDLDLYNIDVESLDYSNVSTKRVLWEILDKARVEQGFDAAKSKLYVQVFPSLDGGCELFVTKFSTEHREDAPSRKYKLSEKNRAERALVHSDFDSICALCRRLISSGETAKTSLYYDDRGTYILDIKKQSQLPSYISQKSKLLNILPPYLSEYGKVIFANSITTAYLCERCRLICENKAAQIISSI